MNWDVAYWAQKQQKALFDLTDEEVRPYLPLPRVLEGLFAVRSRHHASIHADLRVSSCSMRSSSKAFSKWPSSTVMGIVYKSCRLSMWQCGSTCSSIRKLM